MTAARVAAQLYTVREFTNTAEEFRRSLDIIRGIGYTAIQGSTNSPLAVEEYKALLDEHGLTLCATHTGVDELRNNLPAVIEAHQTLGCRNTAISMIPEQYRDSAEGYHEFAKIADEIGAKLAEAGMTLSYHNHAIEFERFPGTNAPALEIIFNETSPQHVLAEVDTYWVQYGGGNPVTWLTKLADRMVQVHLKDYAIYHNTVHFAEVGNGNLEWPAILDACRSANIEWYIVEQDICPGDPFESLALSYQNLTTFGLA